MSESNFNNHYLLFGHGLRIVNIKDDKNIDSSFPLGPDYRVVTLHKPDGTIYNKLVKIITNQIEKKSKFINELFLIKCPIARARAKTELENSFIRDYFINIFNSDPEKLPLALDDILFEDPNSINIKSLQELTKYLDSLNYSDIKSQLNFEIRTYRPGDLCPKLLLDFQIQKKLGNLNGGLYEVSAFRNFDYDNYNENQSLASVSPNDIGVNQIQSIVNFDNKNAYVFDDADVELGKGLSFFQTINDKVSSGLIIVLSCGKYSAKPNPFVRKASLDRQNAPYRKYFIKYN